MTIESGEQIQLEDGVSDTCNPVQCNKEGIIFPRTLTPGVVHAPYNGRQGTADTC